MATAVNPRTRWSFPVWPRTGQESEAFKAGQLFGFFAAAAVGTMELPLFAPSEAMRGKWEQALADRGPGLPLALSALYSVLKVYGSGVVTSEDVLAQFAATELAYLCHGAAKEAARHIRATYLSTDWLLARRRLREVEPGELEEAIAELAREAIGDDQVAPELERRSGVVSNAVVLAEVDRVVGGAARQQLLRLDPYTDVLDDFRRVTAEEFMPRVPGDCRPVFCVGFDTELLRCFPDVGLSEPKGLFIRQYHAETRGLSARGRSLAELYRQLVEDWKQAVAEGRLPAVQFTEADQAWGGASNTYEAKRAAIAGVARDLSREAEKCTAPRAARRLVADLERRGLSPLESATERPAVATGGPWRGRRNVTHVDSSGGAPLRQPPAESAGNGGKARTLPSRNWTRSWCPACGYEGIEFLSYVEFVERSGGHPHRNTVAKRVKDGKYWANALGEVPWCKKCRGLTPLGDGVEQPVEKPHVDDYRPTNADSRQMAAWIQGVMVKEFPGFEYESLGSMKWKEGPAVELASAITVEVLSLAGKQAAMPGKDEVEAVAERVIEAIKKDENASRTALDDLRKQKKGSQSHGIAQSARRPPKRDD